MSRKRAKQPQPFYDVPVKNRYCLSELVDPCVYPLSAVFGKKAFVDTTRWIRGFHTVQGPRWKLITASDGEHELYDLETDAAELNNLAEQRAEKVNELTAWMNEALEKVPQYVPVQAKDAQPELSPAEIQRLRSLGYVD